MKHSFWPAAALLVLPAMAQAQNVSERDTVILRVTSPRGMEVAFSGTITLKDAKEERRLDSLRTPFEIRLWRQDIDARFTALDGGALAGEILTFRNGAQYGHVSGQLNFGTVTLFYEPGESFGFGSRHARLVLP